MKIYAKALYATNGDTDHAKYQRLMTKISELCREAGIKQHPEVNQYFDSVVVAYELNSHNLEIRESKSLLSALTCMTGYISYTIDMEEIPKHTKYIKILVEKENELK